MPARPYQTGPHLYRRGATWYARGGDLPRGGTSLKTTDRAEAERRFAELLTRQRHRPVDGGAAAGALPLSELATRWLEAPHGYTPRTLETHAERIAAVGRALASQHITRPDEITPAVLDTFVSQRARAVSRRTINRDLRTLRVCLRWCAERGLCAPVEALVRAPLRESARSVHRYLPDPSEVTRVLAAVTRKLYRDALTIYYSTGLRYEELYRLTPDDVRDGVVWVQPGAGAAATAEPTKGYRARSIPVAPEVLAVVRRFLDARGPGRGQRAHKNALHAALKEGCRVAGVHRFGLHDLRRAFATEAVRAGVPLTVVRDWLGHRLTVTTERYVGRYRTDAATIAPVPRMLAGTGAASAESVLNPGSGISTNERQRSTSKRLRAVG